MQSVLISIKPKWCRLIANGKKTIEVRKSRPKLETPFKVYIYCTKHKERLLEVVHKGDDMGYCVYDEDTPMFIKTFADTALLGTNLVSKVIGEFVCDRIEMVNAKCSDYGIDLFYQDCMTKGCLTESEVDKYFNIPEDKDLRAMKGNGYGWHITDLKIYDKPKELSEFYTRCNIPESKCKLCDNCYDREDYYGRHYAVKRITRPPQSWCYVEPFGE